MSHIAIKVVVITEKLIMEKVTALMEEAGASGYTVVPAGGKGSRGTRSSFKASVVDAFSNVKIEAIVRDEETGERIIDSVVERFFDTYTGITYLEEVKIVRPDKF